MSQRTGMYTSQHYAGICERLVRKWEVGKAAPQTGAGRAAQEFVCRYPDRLKRLAMRAARKLPEYRNRPISWIFGRQVSDSDAQKSAAVMLDALDALTPMSSAATAM